MGVNTSFVAGKTTASWGSLEYWKGSQLFPFSLPVTESAVHEDQYRSRDMTYVNNRSYTFWHANQTLSVVWITITLGWVKLAKLPLRLTTSLMWRTWRKLHCNGDELSSCPYCLFLFFIQGCPLHSLCSRYWRMIVMNCVGRRRKRSWPDTKIITFILTQILWLNYITKLHHHHQWRYSPVATKNCFFDNYLDVRVDYWLKRRIGVKWNSIATNYICFSLFGYHLN
jgi:hypothetical protein